MTPAIQLLTAAALSAVICIALWQSRGSGPQAVSVGGIAAFIAAMLMLISPIKRLADVANPITRGAAALERGLRLLVTPPSPRTKAATRASARRAQSNCGTCA